MWVGSNHVAGVFLRVLLLERRGLSRPATGLRGPVVHDDLSRIAGKVPQVVASHTLRRGGTGAPRGDTQSRGSGGLAAHHAPPAGPRI